MATKVNIRQRGNTFSYYFSLGKVAGKYKKIEKGGFDTKEEAYNAGIKAYQEYTEGGSVFRPSDSSVADYMDYYVENYVKMNMKANTVLNHIKMIKCHIKPDLGDYKLKSLTSATIQEWVNGKYKRCYAFNTIDNMLKVLNTALKQAVITFGFIRENPAQYVRVPKAAKNGAKESRQPITDEDMKKVIERFPFGHQYHLPIMIGYYTGLRIGEVLGLTWDNVDLKKGAITVSHQLQRIVNSKNKRGIKGTGVYHIESTKTASSERTILIGATLLAELKRWKSVQAANELKLGGDYMVAYLHEEYNEVVEKKIQRVRSYPKAEHGVIGTRINFICTQECGEFIKATAFQHASRVARTELGLDKFDFHSLRHTHATKLIENGANVKDVSARLGHASIDTTLDIYTHDTEIMQNETIELFEKIGRL